MINRKYLKKHGYLSCWQVGKFYSKKNHVYLIRFKHRKGNYKEMVYKIHYSQNNFLRETRILFLLKKSRVPVPKIFHIENKGILMEYLKGPSLLEYIKWQEKVNPSKLIESSIQAIHQLTRWLDIFYDTVKKVTGKNIIMGDVNFRNFIVRESLFGIDFEDCKEGIREEDAGRICAFALTYKPSFTSWKKSLVQEIINVMVSELSLNRNLVIKNMHIELKYMCDRRKLALPEDFSFYSGSNNI